MCTKLPPTTKITEYYVIDFWDPLFLILANVETCKLYCRIYSNQTFEWYLGCVIHNYMAFPRLKVCLKFNRSDYIFKHRTFWCLSPTTSLYKGTTERCHPVYTFTAGWDIWHSASHCSNETTVLRFVDKVQRKASHGLPQTQKSLLIYDVFAAH